MCSVGVIRSFCLGLLWVLCLCGPPAAASEVLVVSGSGSSLHSLDRSQVADIFLGRISSLPGVGELTPLDLPEPSDARETLYVKVMRRTAAQLRAYWAKRSFTGRGTPPREVSGSGELKKLLYANPNMIGYVERASLDSSLKVLYVVQ